VDDAGDARALRRGYRGVAAVRRLLADRTDTFDFDQHTEELIDAGDDVVAFLRWRGRGHGSGAEAEMRLATVTTLQAGKITRVRFYMDRAEALKAAGLLG
jgi:ketosteroid isomerase-like protein